MTHKRMVKVAMALCGVAPLPSGDVISRKWVDVTCLDCRRLGHELVRSYRKARRLSGARR